MRPRIKIVTIEGAVVLAVLGVTLLAPGSSTAVRNAPGNPAYADPLGNGILDGQRFDTEMGLLGHPPDVVDFVQFDQVLFLSAECEDRCNCPTIAYYAQQVDGGSDFNVEACCLTKNSTMVWRGSIRGDSVDGTVEWTARRFYQTVAQNLEFNGTRSSQPVDIGL